MVAGPGPGPGLLTRGNRGGVGENECVRSREVDVCIRQKKKGRPIL